MLNERSEGVYQAISGIGAHEVIIETPATRLNFKNIPEQVEEIIRMWRDRSLDLAPGSSFQYIQIFKTTDWKVGHPSNIPTAR